MQRILIVEDDLAVLRLLYRVFMSAGYEVQVAMDGDAALRAYLHHQIDVVVTDIIMPGKEGLETIRELHRRHPHAKIIAISGAGEAGRDTFLKCASKFGAMRTLAKPFTPEQILKVVAEVLERDPSDQSPHPLG